MKAIANLVVLAAVTGLFGVQGSPTALAPASPGSPGALVAFNSSVPGQSYQLQPNPEPGDPREMYRRFLNSNGRYPSERDPNYANLPKSYRTGNLKILPNGTMLMQGPDKTFTWKNPSVSGVGNSSPAVSMVHNLLTR